jgi:hypothetical protein
MTRKTSRKKIHVINDMPHMYELWDLREFCGKHGRLYICGAGAFQEELLRFFDMSGVAIEGYAATCPESRRLAGRRLPIAAVDELIRQPGVGIIMGAPDRTYRYFIPKFRSAGFADYFTLTEYSKNMIVEQIAPRAIEEMTFEVSLADHCNMSCQMCDHYSQLSPERFVDMGAFERDMKRMGEIFGHRIGAVTLLGGEPTLHRDIIRCMEITRGAFPEGEVIILTNGVLLPKLEHSPQGNVWEACGRLGVNITVTVYPLKFDYAALARKAAEYGVALAMSSDIHADELTSLAKVSAKHAFDLSGNADGMGFVGCCYFNKFNVLRAGRFYMCPVAAHIGIFNAYFGQGLRLREADSLDIGEVGGWEELAAFAARRCPFCGYCDIKNWRSHSQWKASAKTMDEYVD